MRVLLVDDSEPFRDLLAAVAVSAGLEIAGTAASGEEGLRLYTELRPEVVLVDVRLPGMSGFELADTVRALPGEAQVVVVSATDGHREGVISKRSLTPGRLREELGLLDPSGPAQGAGSLTTVE